MFYSLFFKQRRRDNTFPPWKESSYSYNCDNNITKLMVDICSYQTVIYTFIITNLQGNVLVQLLHIFVIRLDNMIRT